MKPLQQDKAHYKKLIENKETYTHIRRFIGFLLSFFWFYFPPILFLISAVYLLWFRAEGIDLLQSLSEYPSFTIGFLPALFLWSLVTWYTTWLLTRIKLKLQPDMNHPVFGMPELADKIPFLLALINFLVVTIALLRFLFPALAENGFWSWLILFLGMIVLIACAAAYGERLRESIKGMDIKARDAFLHRRSLITRLVALAAYLFVVIMAYIGIEEFWLYLWLILATLLSCGAFIILAINRMQYMEETRFIRKRFWLFAYFVPDRSYLSNAFLIFGSLCIAVYAMALFFPTVSVAIGTLTGVFISFAILLAFANLAGFLSVQLRFNLHLFFIILATVLSLFVDRYEVSLCDENPGHSGTHDKRPDIDRYLDQWLKANADSIRACGPGEEFPMFFVITHGGASRSAYWTSGVLSKLEDDSKGRFSRHLFALAGASGGSVGNAVFLCSLKRKRRKEISETAGPSRRFVSNDFLSFTINRLLGIDFIRHIFPMPNLDDRAAALERAMEHEGYGSEEENTAALFSQPFLELWSDSSDTTFLPALLINTTRVQDAMPGVVSNIRIEGKRFGGRLDVMERIPKGKTLKLSTAVVLGARFPYVSPAGKIGDSYFVDGGYFDNSGAGVVHDLISEVEDHLRLKHDSIHSRIRIHIIHITNDKPAASSLSGLHPFINDAAAPLITILGSYTRQTDFYNRRLDKLVRVVRHGSQTGFLWFDLHSNANALGKEESFPMNWFISKKKRASMDDALGRCKEFGEVLELLP